MDNDEASLEREVWALEAVASPLVVASPVPRLVGGRIRSGLGEAFVELVRLVQCLSEADQGVALGRDARAELGESARICARRIESGGPLLAALDKASLLQEPLALRALIGESGEALGAGVGEVHLRLLVELRADAAVARFRVYADPDAGSPFDRRVTDEKGVRATDETTAILGDEDQKP